ncbi:TetR/AcrR family transcriptional regulator [Cryptosporangium arvum]|uniref:Transcriptional regulator n=1 Tax=Cryptosporangium arvum DSM 44712 TaxID=927661 RepID=A0A010YLV1_9ACTN|nr:TetR/AcrR family transcriptional regulator [Cryptosporangium arvum]EXG81195.1 transcriptional regulator [Cryptosporangium arvum DSM 44712]
MPPPRRSQQDRSQTTRTQLVTAGRTLFAERGYAHVSADEIVAAAGLTRGALYHHYGGKEELFAAVFENLEAEVTAEVVAALRSAPDPSAALGLGLARFLDLCARPDVVRIALTDAPAVLGWERWRAIEAAHGLGVLVDALRAAGVRHDVSTAAQLVLSAVIEAALLIAHHPDPARARAGSEQVLTALLSGLLPR